MQKPDNIIFVTITMAGGGTERVISVLANYYAEQGIDVGILMIGGDSVAYQLDSRIEILSLSGATGGSLMGRINRIARMRRYFREHSDAAVIGMGTVAGIFTLIASMGLKNRVVVSERNDPRRLNHKPITGRMDRIRNLLYMQADAIVFQTYQAMEYFPPRVRVKGKVIINPLDDIEQSPVPLEERPKRVIAAGRLIPVKDFSMLIRAFDRFVEKHPEYTLDIFGKGELEESLREEIKSLGREDKIRLPGFTDDIRAEINHSYIYVSTSTSEGISNSIMEALAGGVPVIATDCPIGGSAMLINSGRNGILIPVGDEDALTDAFFRIAEDDALAASFAREAVNIREVASVRKVAEEWYEAVK
ncbi:MAG: glycosyltransferase [Lachnospiraceae bacterium]|nr:glycosyltransferase [Lachnospiraceae bacterium]